MLVDPALDREVSPVLTKLGPLPTKKSLDLILGYLTMEVPRATLVQVALVSP